jgi:hypothetical protein
MHESSAKGIILITACGEAGSEINKADHEAVLASEAPTESKGTEAPAAEG